MKSLEWLSELVLDELDELDWFDDGRFHRLRSEPRLELDEFVVSTVRVRTRLNPLQFSRGAMLEVVTVPDVEPVR